MAETSHVQLKEQGNVAYREGRYKDAVELYSRAITAAGHPGEPVYHTNRALAYFKMGDLDSAEEDCTLALVLDPRHAKAFYRRGTIRKEMSESVKLTAAILDFGSWEECLLETGQRDDSVIATVDREVAGLKAKLSKLKKASAIPKRKSTVPTLARPYFPSELMKVSQRATIVKQIAGIHIKLHEMWSRSRDVIVSNWARMTTQDERTRFIQSAPIYCQGGQMNSSVADIQPATLALKNNLLELIHARASNDPAELAFYLDLPVCEERRLKGEADGDYKPYDADKPTELMMLLPQFYGLFLPVHANASDMDALREGIARGEACDANLGVLVLSRQLVVAFAAHDLCEALVARRDPVVASSITAWSLNVGSRIYYGRGCSSLDRLQQLSLSAQEYTEDHSSELREDAEYVVEHLNDRLPPRVGGRPAKNAALLGTGELGELILNGFARQALWQEFNSIVDSVKLIRVPTLGSGVQLPLAYEAKMGLLLRLVDLAVNLTHKELSAAIEKNFPRDSLEYENDLGFDPFYSSFFGFGMMSVFQSYVTGTPTARKDPLASMMQELAEPQADGQPKRTWRILASLNGLEDFLGRQPQQKLRFSRRTMCALGEYTEAMEMRELLLDAHRPWLDMAKAEWSSFVHELGPLWKQLERSWNLSVTAPLVQKLLVEQSTVALEAIWRAFELKAVKQLKKTPRALFRGLLSTRRSSSRATATSPTSTPKPVPSTSKSTTASASSRPASSPVVGSSKAVDSRRGDDSDSTLSPSSSCGPLTPTASAEHSRQNSKDLEADSDDEMPPLLAPEPCAKGPKPPAGRSTMGIEELQDKFVDFLFETGIIGDDEPAAPKVRRRLPKRRPPKSKGQAPKQPRIITAPQAETLPASSTAPAVEPSSSRTASSIKSSRTKSIRASTAFTAAPPTSTISATTVGPSASSYTVSATAAPITAALEPAVSADAPSSEAPQSSSSSSSPALSSSPSLEGLASNSAQLDAVSDLLVAAQSSSTYEEPPVRRVKIKTRKAHSSSMLRTTSNASDVSSSAADDSSSAESTKVCVPKGYVFKVTKKVYGVFEKRVGIGSHIRKREIYFRDFVDALSSVGLLPVKKPGSSWKFQPDPSSVLSGQMTINFHEPHPDSYFREHQTHNAGKRLNRAYGFNMDMFEIDTSRRDQQVC